MARYRLRFVLQEFDLPQGTTLIGRSLDCHLTIEDPLVSRQHARIFVDEDGARIEDLRSRNGVKVNGVSIVEPVMLRSGDRIRIGTQDFVFSCVAPATYAHSRTTGQLRLCANCGLPYPREMLACPSCEATEQTDDDTLTGSGSSARPQSWTLQLVIEGLDRALRLGRTADADRLFRRATAQLEEFLASGGMVEGKALASLAMHAFATALASNDPAWALWAIDMYGHTRQVPPTEVLEKLAEVAAGHRAALRAALDTLFGRLASASSGALDEDAEARDRLERFHRGLLV